MATKRKRVFISFDFDHDENLRNLLVGQAEDPDSPFHIADWSVKEAMPGDWIKKVRDRIRKTDLTIVICGEHTHKASGVAAELRITRRLGKPYFLLCGHPKKSVQKPTTASQGDDIYKWTWKNLKLLIRGER